MEQNVKALRGLALSGLERGVAGVPGQRRWIRLTFAGRDRMTGIRWELPLSSVAGPRRTGAVPHSVAEGSPCGWARCYSGRGGLV